MGNIKYAVRQLTKLHNEAARRMKRQPHLRVGQAYVGALIMIDVAAYDKFTSGNALPTDCFYDDSKLGLLLSELFNYWVNSVE